MDNFIINLQMAFLALSFFAIICIFGGLIVLFIIFAINAIEKNKVTKGIIFILISIMILPIGIAVGATADDIFADIKYSLIKEKYGNTK